MSSTLILKNMLRLLLTQQYKHNPTPNRNVPNMHLTLHPQTPRPPFHPFQFVFISLTFIFKNLLLLLHDPLEISMENYLDFV